MLDAGCLMLVTQIDNQVSRIEYRESRKDMKYKGRFGDYGGFYVPEVLIPALEELEEAFYRFYQGQTLC